MRLETIHIRNFRLLRRVSLDLAAGKTTTVLVGPNNSGKTSIMDALRLFTGTGSPARKVTLHDLAKSRHKQLKRVEKALNESSDGEQKIAIVRKLAPRMRMDLIFSYSQAAADLIAATELLMDLNPSSNIVRLRAEYSIANAKELITDFESRPHQTESLCDFLKDKYDRYFGRSFFKVSIDGKESEPLDDAGFLKRLIKVDMVPAQRHVDDEGDGRSVKISQLFHDHYSSFYQASDAQGYQAIEDAIADSTSDLTAKYDTAFERLFTRLKGYGFPQGQGSHDLKIRAEMSSATLYRDNARVYYASEETGAGGEVEKFELPERYNGLGYKNLIFIVLQLESFRAALEAADDIPRVHIIGIEEPEAHLHPQMQTVFIAEISKTLEEGTESTAQVILSTHSSHMIANSGFEPVRYFRRSRHDVRVRDLSKLPIPANQPGVVDFLRRYIRLTHCDLFFADKAILVEGQVERLLLPLMIGHCAALDTCKGFESQYISVSEIGGAYAHKFKPIVDFLGIPTLIITDIDSIDDNRKKCPVAEGKKTSNACLKNWLPGKEALADLVACDEAGKTQGHIRVAFQTSEEGACGRSFEEAFIYSNLEWLEKHHAKLAATGDDVKAAVMKGLKESAWELGGNLAKVDFALDLMAEQGWKTPAYIRDGLVWLAAAKAA